VTGLAELAGVVAVGAIRLAAPRFGRMASQERRGMIRLARVGPGGIGTVALEALRPHMATHAGSRTRRSVRSVTLPESCGVRCGLLARDLRADCAIGTGLRE